MLLQICRVEEIIVEGSIEGSVVHFQWVRTVIIQPSGSIVASGLGIILFYFFMLQLCLGTCIIYMLMTENNLFLLPSITVVIVRCNDV